MHAASPNVEWHCINVTRRLLERWQQHERQLAEVEKGMVKEDEVEEILTPDEKERVAHIKRRLVQ
jgi:hypothetical protein